MLICGFEGWPWNIGSLVDFGEELEVITEFPKEI